MQVTKNFSLRELTRSETARRAGVPNEPSPAEMDNIYYTAQQLEKIREYVGRPIIVTSCFRSERVNKLVGGSRTCRRLRRIGYDLAGICQTVNQNA